MITAICIGNFDGVHLAHAALIHAARRGCAQRDATAQRVIAVTFDPHPASVLANRPVAPPGVRAAPRLRPLTTLDSKRRLLLDAGADAVDVLDPRDGLLEQSAEDFIRAMVLRHAPALIVEGDDFRFGRARSAGLAELAALGSRYQFDTLALPPVHQALRDQTLVRVSSSAVRRLLAHGRVRDAALLLGRAYDIQGTVVSGDRRGRLLGFPTANIVTDAAVPGEGVYAAIAHLPDGTRHAAAVNIGAPPTFDASDQRIEAHLLLPRTLDGTLEGASGDDWSALPGLPEYGWPIRLEFLGWVRDQVRFSGVGALKGQLARDCARVRAVVAGWLGEGATTAAAAGGVPTRC